mmetsp:Transcript_120435/g.221483  ORF Transcript_120435/g.221483 Transcript_120435/m.221483 type:complete len:254 (-) Transcript_120435:4104-4865(-)
MQMHRHSNVRALRRETRRCAVRQMQLTGSGCWGAPCTPGSACTLSMQVSTAPQNLCHTHRCGGLQQMQPEDHCTQLQQLLPWNRPKGLRALGGQARVQTYGRGQRPRHRSCFSDTLTICSWFCICSMRSGRCIHCTRGCCHHWHCFSMVWRGGFDVRNLQRSMHKICLLCVTQAWQWQLLVGMVLGCGRHFHTIAAEPQARGAVSWRRLPAWSQCSASGRPRCRTCLPHAGSFSLRPTPSSWQQLRTSHRYFL